VTALLAALALSAPSSAEEACLAVGDVAEATQVVWISPVRARVRARSWMEVIELGDLEAWAKDNGKEPARFLQAAGVVGRKARRAESVVWKVTIFDVDRDATCRPIQGALAGTAVASVPACATDQQHPARGAHPGFTGCGYARDTGSGSRGLDVLRVRWEDAAREGFCVMPLDRFLEGL
jgi:hypothetical protein